MFRIFTILFIVEIALVHVISLPQMDGKIEHGLTLRGTKVPQMALIKIGSFFGCSGSLIGKQFVGSTAGCIKKMISLGESNFRYVSVYFGMTDFTEGIQKIGVENVDYPGAYDNDKLSHSYDIGLILLKEPVKLRANVQVANWQENNVNLQIFDVPGVDDSIFYDDNTPLTLVFVPLNNYRNDKCLKYLAERSLGGAIGCLYPYMKDRKLSNVDIGAPLILHERNALLGFVSKLNGQTEKSLSYYTIIYYHKTYLLSKMNELLEKMATTSMNNFNSSGPPPQEPCLLPLFNK